MNSMNFDIKQDLDFEVKRFDFIRYKLMDGIVLRLVCIPVKILKTEKYDIRGIPHYIMQSQSILSAVDDDALREFPANFNLMKKTQRI